MAGSVRLYWPELKSNMARELPVLADKTILVFAVRLEVPPDCLESIAGELDSLEMERADRFFFARDRQRYVVCRAALRRIVGAYTGSSPREVRFAYGPNGKPRVDLAAMDGQRRIAQGQWQKADGQSERIEFNVSHSQDLALIAVCRGWTIGIDVERVRPIPDAGELVNRFFSRCESAVFQQLEAELQPESFFNLWTRKEAWLKATGEGIGHLLNRVEVTFLPWERARLLKVPDGSDEAGAWSVRDLAPAAGYAGALAVKAADVEVQRWSWPGLTQKARLKSGEPLN